jgi:hypothetical protein
MHSIEMSSDKPGLEYCRYFQSRDLVQLKIQPFIIWLMLRRYLNLF